MSDETRAVPTSVDIEAIRHDLERQWITPAGLCAVVDRLLAALDGERRHRADLEREAVAVIGLVNCVLMDIARDWPEWQIRSSLSGQLGVARDRCDAFLARQVVQEATGDAK